MCFRLSNTIKREVKKMKSDKLEPMLGKKVEVILFDDTTYTGILRKTRDKMFRNNPSLFYPWKYYFLTDETNQCISCLFRISHVQKCKLID